MTRFLDFSLNKQATSQKNCLQGLIVIPKNKYFTENKQTKNDTAWKKSDGLYSYRYRQLQAVFSLEKYKKENKQTDINFVFSFSCAVNQKKTPISSLQKKSLW